MLAYLVADVTFVTSMTDIVLNPEFQAIYLKKKDRRCIKNIPMFLNTLILQSAV